MGKLTIEQSQPLIMGYKSGLAFEDIPDFIKAVEAFVNNAKSAYIDKKVQIYFLPEDMVDMYMAASQDTDWANGVPAAPAEVSNGR